MDVDDCPSESDYSDFNNSSLQVDDTSCSLMVYISQNDDMPIDDMENDMDDDIVADTDITSNLPQTELLDNAETSRDW